MARNAPRVVYGVHGVTPYSRTTGLPYGEIRVLKGSSVSMQSELAELMGGSSKFSWAAEEGAITAEMTLNVNELPNFLFELFLGKAPTSNSAETSGNVSTLTDKYGTSIVDPTNGIASVFLLAGSAANLKFGKYVIKAVTSAQFNLYYLTGIDIARGTDGSFSDDTLLVAASVAFTASVASVPAFGLSFAQVGTPSFAVGDTATFEVRPVNSASMDVTIGASNDTTFSEFGALVYSQRRGNQEMFEMDLYRCKGAGMPIPFEMGAFYTGELKAKILYDSVLDAIGKIRHVQPA